MAAASRTTKTEEHVAIVRRLTHGEVAMARSIFKDAIDYGTVRVHNKGYLWFGLQPDNVAMSPNGEIFFTKNYFKDDFSRESSANRRWFMHEMVHVWQYQLGYPVRIRGAIRIGLDYTYQLDPKKRLKDYNMEAQGDLLADYFALKTLNAPAVMRQSDYAGHTQLYEQILGDFLVDPKNPSNLP